MPAGDKHDPNDVSTALWLLKLGVPSRKIEAHLRGRIDHATICRLRRMRQPVAQQIVSELDASIPERDLPSEIAHYSPSLASSFNRGLGSTTPPKVIDKVVKENNEINNFIAFRNAKFQLLSVLSEKNSNAVANRFREALKKRVSSLGFDVNSDNDVQFGQLNDMANVGLAVIRIAAEKARKLNLSKLVDAAILYRRPDWKGRLENIRRTFQCPLCLKPRSFIESKDHENVICVSCGSTTPSQSARFKISTRKIDLEYVDLVHSAATSRQSKVFD